MRKAFLESSESNASIRNTRKHCKVKFFRTLSQPQRRVPHIWLVFGEMWDTANLKSIATRLLISVSAVGIPHLAKNGRDVATGCCGQAKNVRRRYGICAGERKKTIAMVRVGIKTPANSLKPHHRHGGDRPDAA